VQHSQRGRLLSRIWESGSSAGPLAGRGDLAECIGLLATARWLGSCV
jgi:hypothetical protein